MQLGVGVFSMDDDAGWQMLKEAQLLYPGLFCSLARVSIVTVATIMAWGKTAILISHNLAAGRLY